MCVCEGAYEGMSAGALLNEAGQLQKKKENQ